MTSGRPRPVRARRPAKSRGRRAAAFAAALSAACGPQPLAQAGDRRLEVDDAARLIASHSAVAADTQVVRAVAELWVDYTLLTAHLLADDSLESLDVDDLAGPALDDLTVRRLLNRVVDVDTSVSAEELARRFAADLPGARATASQILLRFPPSATTRQRDSVRATASDLRAQLVRGASFSAMASRHSGDPGSASRGGRMGTFARGEMLAPIDSAVFALEPGETSDPVATELGYHLVRLDAVEAPSLADAGEDFRRRLQRERRDSAEADYLVRLDSMRRIRVQPGARERARALAERSPRRLSSAAAEQPLATWTDGAYSAGDLLAVIRRSGPGFARDVATASFDDLDAALTSLARRELLLAEARARGVEPTPEQADSVRAELRALVRDRAAAVGLLARTDGGEVEPDSTGAERADSGAARGATDRVEAAIADIVSGRRELVPLGGVVLLLRNGSDWRVDDAAVRATVRRIREEPSR